MPFSIPQQIGVYNSPMRVPIDNRGSSLERIEEYIHLEQEPEPTKEGVPPATWPSSGHLVVENLSARYSEDSLNVLHDISFTVKSGERIGVGE